MPKFLRSLFGQVVLALVVGVVIGLVWPESAVKLKPLGDGFIKLIKMVIPVLVFCVVVHGIAGAGDDHLALLGSIGGGLHTALRDAAATIRRMPARMWFWCRPLPGLARPTGMLIAGGQSMG